MSTYLVLARKYRPRVFAEVVGQEVVTRILEGALAEGRVGHAYLFAGPRGTGKTTMARIFAKCLNCEKGPGKVPCGTCESCRAADEGSAVDIIELDAASHNSVDTIRELRDEVGYAPMRSRYKVYIVDEVHMLSKPAFNALLKTLEEPPRHVVFLFATTDPHKVLETVLSRCQVLRLEALSEAQIAGRLTEVFGKEGVRPAEGVVEELARDARGGMRDALSLADELLALAGDEPTLEDLHRLGGDGGQAAIQALLGCAERGDKSGLLEALAQSGGDAELCGGLLEELRRSVVLFHCGEDAPWVQLSESERRAARERAERLGGERLELWMQELLRARERMRLFPGQERLVLEVTLLDLCDADATAALADLVRRLEALETRGGPAAERPHASAPRPARTGPAPSRTPPPGAGPERLAAPAGGSAGPSGARTADGGIWKRFLAELGRTTGSLAALLEEHGHLEEGPGAPVVVVHATRASERRMLVDRRMRSAAARAMSAVLGRESELELRVIDGPAQEGGGAAEEAPEPADARAEEAAEEAVAEQPAGEEPAGAALPEGGESATLVPRKKPDAPVPPRSKPKSSRPADGFTREVADLFGGVIEDLP